MASTQGDRPGYAMLNVGNNNIKNDGFEILLSTAPKQLEELSIGTVLVTQLATISTWLDWSFH